MSEQGYQASKDPYCYPDSTVLRNKPGYRTQGELDDFEALATASRFALPLPPGVFDTAHYRAIHKHLFQDVFEWAGEYRTVRIGKGGSMFCYPEYIEAEMQALFPGLPERLLDLPLTRQEFAQKASAFLSDLNAVHPFREGNGRTQLAFLTVLSEQVGHPLDLASFTPKEILQAMIGSFRGELEPLAAIISGKQ